MICEDRVAIVTGAGRGIGRAHALELARQGAKVVVNDYGVSLAGERPGGRGDSPADEVVAEIREAAAAGDPVLRWFTVDLVLADGTVVAQVRKQLYVRRKR